MHELIRNLLLLALAGAAATVAGSGVAWWRDEPRRMRRLMARALGAAPEMVVIARDRGLAAGFNLAAGRVAVLWDDGMKGLVYRLDQLVGAELMLDDQVAARAYRDEQRRALDAAPSEAKRVMLRLVFDNPAHPDFELPLWPPADPARVQQQTAFDAVQEARRWISSVEALLRKSATTTTVRSRSPEPEAARAEAQALQPTAHAPPARPPLPLFEAAPAPDRPDDESEDGPESEDGEDPPWDEDEDNRL